MRTIIGCRDTAEPEDRQLTSSPVSRSTKSRTSPRSDLFSLMARLDLAGDVLSNVSRPTLSGVERNYPTGIVILPRQNIIDERF